MLHLFQLACSGRRWRGGLPNHFGSRWLQTIAWDRMAKGQRVANVYSQPPLPPSVSGLLRRSGEPGVAVAPILSDMRVRSGACARWQP